MLDLAAAILHHIPAFGLGAMLVASAFGEGRRRLCPMSPFGFRGPARGLARVVRAGVILPV